MEEEKLSIKINVAERSYSLKIAVVEEERIRAAAKCINEKVMQYRQRYANPDVQDALSMIALQYMMKLMEYEEVTDIAPLLQGVQQLDKQLEDYLRNIAG